MSQNTRGPFRADHVGSFLRPAPLRDAIAKAVAEKRDPSELTSLQDKYVREIVAFQEDLGLNVVTDGEFRHASFHNFLEKLDGVTVGRPEAKPDATKKSFEPRTYSIQGKLRHSRPIELNAFKFLKSVSHVVPKVTMASPTMLMRAGRDDVSREIYPDMEQYYDDIPPVFQAEIGQLADAGCRYVQLDDTNYAYLCDPALRARRELGGTNLAALSLRYAKLINDSIAKRPADMAAAIHICRGNSSGQFAAQGGYEPIAEVLLNEIKVDGYFLEYDDQRSGGFEPLRFFPKGSKKKVVLGLVSTKRTEIENKDDLKRRIDEATKYVPLENLCVSPQCGFASTYLGNPTTEEVQKAKMKLVVDLAREVWGTAA
ncbi:MAG: 5-methyltetrahydropteroyltriglutamate--homocysteine S-methyltransferase [Xanthobacteraceae bacterium]